MSAGATFRAAMMGLALALAIPGRHAASGRQAVDDPGLAAAVQRFFATQQAEDVDGYLALWSASAPNPQRARMLTFVFATGDDVFSDVTIVRAAPQPDGVRLRVSATRDRTEPGRNAGDPPVTRRTRMLVSLTFAREGDDWKLVREGPATDDLAAALLDAATPAEREALMNADAELVSDRLLASLSSRGTEAAQQQRYQAARVAYERVLEVARRLANREAEGDALQNLGNAFYFLRDLPAALDAYGQRLILERERGSDARVAGAQSGIATIRYSYAEYGAALVAYREALAIQERLGDLPAVATTLISTGNVLYLQGDYEAAIRDYSRSREISRKALDTFGEARALEGLGRVLMARGDYASALQVFAAVQDDAKARGDVTRQASAALSIGEAHFRLGNLDTARAAFEESRRGFETAGDLANVGRVWQSIALVELSAGRFAPAEAGYRRSTESCTKASDRECVAGATVGVAFAQSAQDRFVEAIATYRTAIEMFTALRRSEPAARAEVGLSAAYLGARDYQAAVDAAGRAQRAAAALENDDVLWRAHVAEARGLRGLQRRDLALEAVRQAADAVDRLLRTASLRPSARVSADSSSVFALRAILDAEAADAAAAHEAAERLRVHELRVTLLPAERDIAHGMTDAERDEERAALAEIVSWDAQLTRERGLPKPDAARLERLRRGLDDAIAVRSAQQQRLFDRLPDLRMWRGEMAPASRAEIEAVILSGARERVRGGLEPDESTAALLLVQIVVDDQDLLFLWARPDGERVAFQSHVAPIARRTLAERVGTLVQPDTLRSVETWRKASAAFVEGFPRALIKALAVAGRTIVIPHDVLWRVPFEALAVEGRYLAESSDVSYAASATALVRTRPIAVSPAGPPITLLAAGAPRLASTLERFVAQTTPGWTIRPADAAERELTRVAAQWPAKSATASLHAAATETALRAALGSADVVHLAVPFRFNGASPLFSSMLLAEEPPSVTTVVESADGVIELREIVNLALRARLAVLSDDAAMSARDAADSAPTVQWGWRTAGVSTLLLARWPVEGGSDALLSDFHRHLRAGAEPDRALRTARAAQRAVETFDAPYYWAGWLLVGR